MAAKISMHVYGTKLRHYRPIYEATENYGKTSFSITAADVIDSLRIEELRHRLCEYATLCIAREPLNAYTCFVCYDSIIKR